MKRLDKVSEERTMTVIEDMMKQFANNFSLLHSKENKGQKYNATHKQKTMTNGVDLNDLSIKETEDAKSFSEEDKEEIIVMTKRTFKN